MFLVKLWAFINFVCVDVVEGGTKKIPCGLPAPVQDFNLSPGFPTAAVTVLHAPLTCSFRGILFLMDLKPPLLLCGDTLEPCGLQEW